MGLFNIFSRDLGIDLGTANTLVQVRGKGIVMREPSVVAIRSDTKAILAVGEEAKRRSAVTPGNIGSHPPNEGRGHCRFRRNTGDAALFYKEPFPDSCLFIPGWCVCVPSGVTEVEKRAVDETTRSAGAKEAYLIEETMAAAMGAGLPIQEPTGSMVVDIGGGTSEVAIISLGGIVTSRSIRVGGNKLDEAIISHIKKNTI